MTTSEPQEVADRSQDSSADRPGDGEAGEIMTAREASDQVALDVPYGLTVAAAWSWRLLIAFAAIAAAVWLFSHVSLLIIPLLIAALLATLLHPLHQRLRRIHVPAGLSVLLCILLLTGAVVGLFWVAGQQLAVGFSDMWGQVIVAYQGLIAWLASMGVTVDQWNAMISDLVQTVSNNSQAILSGALGFGSTAGNIAAGTVLTIFALIFFLLDGERIWNFLLNFVPRRHRRAFDGAGRAGWHSLGSYARIQIFVAFVDAVGIGLGAWLLGVPLALPIAVLVFLGSFVPLIGAVVTGAVAVLLALMANGLGNALLMLGVVLLVQQIEGNILQPLIMGRAVSLHPLAVFLAVSGGTVLLGLVGAVFAVPVMAFLNTTVKYFAARPWKDQDEAQGTGPPNTTLAERAAALQGPVGRAYGRLDGAVRRVSERTGSHAVKGGETLKNDKTITRAPSHSGHGSAGQDGAVGPSTAPGRNTDAGRYATGENTGVQRSGTPPGQDGGTS